MLTAEMLKPITFNNNIRCIEIGWGIDKVKKHQGLITT